MVGVDPVGWLSGAFGAFRRNGSWIDFCDGSGDIGDDIMLFATPNYLENVGLAQIICSCMWALLCTGGKYDASGDHNPGVEVCMMIWSYVGYL